MLGDGGRDCGGMELSAKDTSRVIRMAAMNTHLLFNRTEQITRIATYNTAAYVRTVLEGSEDTESIEVPVAMHTFGAGKTALGGAYLKRLSESIPEKVAKTFPGHEEEVRKSLVATADRGKMVFTFACATVAETASLLAYFTRDLVPRSERFVAALEDANDSIARMMLVVQEARKLVPLFLMVDEIGLMKYGELIKLRNILRELHIRTASETAQPLHLYLCGRVDYRADPLARGSQLGAVVLSPLSAGHIGSLRQQLGMQIHTRAIRKEEVELAFDEEVARVTAGIPRHLRRLLAVVQVKGIRYSHAEEARTGVLEVARVMAKDRQLYQDYEWSDDDAAQAFAGMVAAEAMEKTFEEDDALLDYCRQLPVMQVKVAGGVRVRCAPLCTWNLAERLDKVAVAAASGALDAFFLTTATGAGSARGTHVIRGLQRRLVHPLLLHQLAGGKSTDGVAVQLKRLLPFLPDTIADQQVRLGFMAKEMDRITEACCSSFTSKQRWAIIDEWPMSICRPQGQAVAADVFITTGAVRQGEFAMIELQVVAGKQAFDERLLLGDCIAQPAKPPVGEVLRIVVADALTDWLGGEIKKGSDTRVYLPGEDIQYKGKGKTGRRRAAAKKTRVPGHMILVLVRRSAVESFAAGMKGKEDDEEQEAETGEEETVPKLRTLRKRRGLKLAGRKRRFGSRLEQEKREVNGVWVADELEQEKEHLPPQRKKIVTRRMMAAVKKSAPG